MHSNISKGFYENTEPGNSFVYCFIVPYFIEDSHCALYVKNDLLDYIIVTKERVNRWYKPASKRSIIEAGHEKFVKFITDVPNYKFDISFSHGDGEIEYYYNQDLITEIEPLKTTYFYFKNNEKWRNFENYKEHLELILRRWNDLEEQDTVVIYKSKLLECDG